MAVFLGEAPWLGGRVACDAREQPNTFRGIEPRGNPKALVNRGSFAGVASDAPSERWGAQNLPKRVTFFRRTVKNPLGGLSLLSPIDGLSLDVFTYGVTGEAPYDNILAQL